MIYPGMYELKDPSVFSEIEAEIQTEIDSLGALNQYNNAIDLPEGFDINAEFSMDAIYNIELNESPWQIATRKASFGSEGPEGQETTINPEIANLNSLAYCKYLKYFAGVRGLACPSIVSDMDFYIPDGFCGLYNREGMDMSWVLSISWTQAQDGFEYVYHEVDNNQIKYSLTNQGFNYRLYHVPIPDQGKFFQGRISRDYSFEWKIRLGADVCQRVCQEWRGLRA